MHQLRMYRVALSTVLLALAVRMLISGTTPAVFALAVIFAALLIASLLLSRKGRQIEPSSTDELSGGRSRNG